MIDNDGTYKYSKVVEAGVAKPTAFKLEQNYPNPFNPETRITFSMREAGSVNLSVFNLKGQLVRELTARNFGAGVQTVTWDGKDNNGKVMPSGTYLYKLRVNGFEITRKMEFVK